MIVVAGESLVDLIATGDQLRAVPGGGPYNVARTVARLEQPCVYLGPLSRDRFGVRLREALSTDGVDDRWAPSSEDPTTLAVAQIGQDGAATYGFYVERTSAAALSEAQALAVLEARPRVLYVGTLGLVLEPVATSLEALVAALDDQVLLALDPNCRPAVVRDEPAYRARLQRVLARADLVKVSTEDLAFLSPGIDPVDAAAAMVAAGPALVLVTDGGDDVHAVTGVWHRSVPVPRVAVVDTVGAGDAFCGAFLSYWYRERHDREQLRDWAHVGPALRFATEVAAITCQRQGADPPRAAELAAVAG
ncbi:MAG: fructokinase [Actinomycetota bacterium]|nr:fructokinase [Actinomycetota bacterium]